MYVEIKCDGLTGYGRICRVGFSKSGKTLRYGRRSLRSLKGRGFKANYFDVDTGEECWVAGPRRDGQDTLYPGLVEIDEDVREEYWTVIRGIPSMVAVSRFRSEGKYSRRRPRPELSVHGSSRVGCTRRK
jgi:hypothetical protein